MVICCILLGWPAAAVAAVHVNTAPTVSAYQASMDTVTVHEGVLGTAARDTQRHYRALERELARDEATLDARQAAAALAAQRAAAAAAEAAKDAVRVTVQSPPATTTAQQAGIYSYSQLEQLWVSAGGPASVEAAAATIAECESGGNPDAYNPSGASGLWQILGQVVAGNIFNPMVNALNAVAKYNAAGGFSPWVCQA